MTLNVLGKGGNMKNSEWVQDKEDRVTVLEQKLNSAISDVFTGTMAEYKEAVSKKEIQNGMLVVLTRLE